MFAFGSLRAFVDNYTIILSELWYNRSMNKQMSLSVLNVELLQVQTKKKNFFNQIERIVPWGEWITLIKL